MEPIKKKSKILDFYFKSNEVKVSMIAVLELGRGQGTEYQFFKKNVLAYLPFIRG